MMSPDAYQSLCQQFRGAIRDRVSDGNISLDTILEMLVRTMPIDEMAHFLISGGYIEEADDPRVVETRISTDDSMTERGNTWLIQCEEGYHLAYFKLDPGKNLWIELSIVPPNYPGLHLEVIQKTEYEIVRHINMMCGGWLIRKANIAGIRHSAEWEIVGDDDADTFGGEIYYTEH